MKATVYLSRKLLNQLKVKETESKDLMLTHNLHNIIINGKRVGCSGHIQNVLNNKCVYVSTEKSCYQPLSDKNLVRYAASMKDYSSVSLGAKGHKQKEKKLMETGIKNQIVIVSAVAAVLLIVMSVCAIAESITFEKVAVLAASVLALNKCCGILLN